VGALAPSGVDRHAHPALYALPEEFLIRGLTRVPSRGRQAASVVGLWKERGDSGEAEAALQGIRILDFSRYMQGLTVHRCGRYGADVIKVERVGRVTRTAALHSTASEG